MRSEGKKRTLELSLIQGFSKIEKLFGGATSFRTVCLESGRKVDKEGRYPDRLFVLSAAGWYVYGEGRKR